MIARMSKVEIVGPDGLLSDVLTLLQKLSVLQLDTELGEGQEAEASIRPFLHDQRERALFERLFLDDLRRKIEELFTYLPRGTSIRTSYLDPQSILATILYTVEKHVKNARELYHNKAALKREVSELGHFAGFLNTLDSIFKAAHTPPDFDIIGLTIKDKASVDHVRSVVDKMTGGNFKMFTVPAGDGTLAGMITIEKSLAEDVSRELTKEHVPEMSVPPEFDGLSMAEKITYLEAESLKLEAEVEEIDQRLAEMGKRWTPLYNRVLEWIGERSALLTATASIRHTGLCFFLTGWMPSDDVGKVKAQIEASFGMQVVMEEKHMREEELEQAPIIVSNPAYFKPFEMFSRMLPLPAYSSFDPTPFIGIFFPIFFGMILGDAGYGLVLLVLTFVLIRRFKKKKSRVGADASQVLLVSSLYTILFGLLYGELFGDLGTRLFGLEPLLIERRTSIVPMMVFAVSAGVFHVLVGLGLGAITAFRRKFPKEGVAKMLNIVIILCMVAVFASFFGYAPVLLSRPMVTVILIAMPFLFFTGGLLAPLELLKNIGNIISYVRIMAIGLTSVLLAFVANELAGAMGDVVIGVAVAALLHVLNMVLGVFSPTIHSLRLHYVEFFSKFVESGGRKFEPLGK
jgi:V/A-type H+/Na+-transporting ATPase subunit I